MLGPSQGPRDESVKARKAARRVAFRGLRVGSGALATLAPPEASPRRVRVRHQAAVTPARGHDMRPSLAALQALTLTSRGPCDESSIKADPLRA